MTAPPVVYATLWLLIVAVAFAQIAAAVLPLLILIYLVPPEQRPDLVALVNRRVRLREILRVRRARRTSESSTPERGP